MTKKSIKKGSKKGKLSNKKRSKQKTSDFKAVWLVFKYLGIGLFYIFKYLGIIFYTFVKILWKGIFIVYLKIKKLIKSKKRQKENNKKIKNSSALDTKKSRSSIDNYDAFSVVETLEGSYSNFEDFLLSNKSTIGLILGARGTGKSTIGMRILENVHIITKRECYAMGFKAEELPRFIKSVGGISDLENDGIVLIDEGGILFNARNSMDNANKLLSELLLIARHKDLSVIFITQNSSNLEVNVIRQADYLILKPSSLLQKDFERKKIQKLYHDVSDKFKQYQNRIGITYLYSNKFVGFITNTVPSFWNEDLSKSFSGE